MHSKQVGNIAELAAAKVIAQQGFPVFKEYGDLCKVDIITIIDNKTVKIQVKHGSRVRSASGVVSFSLVKNGPDKYRYRYMEEDVDIFAVYISEIDKVVFMSWKDIDSKYAVNIRYIKSKNNQTSGTRWYEDYLDIKTISGL